MSRNLPVSSAMVIGKKERTHLQLMLDCGETKWPAIFWGAGEKLHTEFEIGDRVDIIFNVERNIFNKTVTLQLNIKEMRKSI